MKIWILTMEDPVYTVDFIKEIIHHHHSHIEGLTIARGNRLKIGKKRSKPLYILSLFLIMGCKTFIRFSTKTFSYKLKKQIDKIFPLKNFISLQKCAYYYNIPVSYTNNPNGSEYIEMLKTRRPDIIINQSQFIIKKELLNIATIGILNRHNALLPKNRGRITPFWVLYNEEAESGVSIHFVDEGIDSGPILVQKRFNIDKNETFGSLVKKNYKWANKAIIEALDNIEKGPVNYIPNIEEQATYNTIPSLREAWEYRKRRFSKILSD